MTKISIQALSEIDFLLKHLVKQRGIGSHSLVPNTVKKITVSYRTCTLLDAIMIMA